MILEPTLAFHSVCPKKRLLEVSFISCSVTRFLVCGTADVGPALLRRGAACTSRVLSDSRAVHLLGARRSPPVRQANVSLGGSGDACATL